MKKQMKSKRYLLFVTMLCATFTVVFTASISTFALTVEGNKYSQTTVIAGKKLKLIGAGVREKWLFDIYTMGAYTESGTCELKSIRYKDEVKYLQINMLRDVSKKNMTTALREALENNTPKNASEELKKQIRNFTSYVNKCDKGTVMEMIYIPGKGTTLKYNGKQYGSIIKGKDFHVVLWDCYFSSKTCCKGLKSQILKTCK